MPSIPPLQNVEFDEYWKRRASAAAEFWRQRKDTAPIRSAIRLWILAKAKQGPPPSLGGLVPEARVDLPGLLDEESQDLAVRFATLNRSGEDDEMAEWMLAAAAADALERITEPNVLTAALDLTSGPLGHKVLIDELLLKIEADAGFGERLEALATKLVSDRAHDPGGAFLDSQRSRFEIRRAEWCRQPDILELFREPISEVWPSDEEERFALSLLRRCNLPRYVELVAQCDVPEIVSGILADIQWDAEAIAEVIRLAPSAVADDRWNGMILAPLVLQIAHQHLTERLLRDRNDDETLGRLVDNTRALFVGALARRSDASWLSLVWSITLFEDLARRSRHTQTPPPLRSAANGPWQLLDALTGSQLSKLWSSIRVEGLGPEVSILIHCARILAAMSSDTQDLPALSSLIPATIDEEALSAARRLVSLAPNVENYLYDVLGWQLAQADDQTAEWLSLWGLALPFREGERHRYGGCGALVDASPVAKIIWAAGLHTTFWLRSQTDDPRRSMTSKKLTAHISDAAREQELTSYVDDPFWLAASAHAVMATAADVKAGRSPPEDLAQAVRLRAGTTPQFLRIVHSLISDKLPTDLLFRAVPGGRDGLSSLVANASAIGQLDPGFAQQTGPAVKAVDEMIRGNHIHSTS